MSLQVILLYVMKIKSYKEFLISNFVSTLIIGVLAILAFMIYYLKAQNNEEMKLNVHLTRGIHGNSLLT